MRNPVNVHIFVPLRDFLFYCRRRRLIVVAGMVRVSVIAIRLCAMEVQI